MDPRLLTAAAITAALIAVAIGWSLRPAARSRRRQRRELIALNRRRVQLEQQVAAEWLRIHGRLAVRDAEALMLRLLADHPEIHHLQTRTKRGVR